jgi:diadenosine tetraphosphate (Ap4A) HIT family hydrolase
MTYRECPFCRQLAELDDVSAGDMVWQFPQSIVLLGTWQYYLGYCLLIARRHATELSQLADEERRGFLDEMCLAARAIEATFHPLKMNYELLGNQVPHLHWHLFPRYATDPEVVRPVWLALARAETDEMQRARLQTGPVERTETANKLRRQLLRLTSKE